jgi:hypothetical protein
MHKLGTVKVLGVIHIGGQQHCANQGNRHQHRIGQRMEATTLVEPQRHLVGQQRQCQTQ